MERVPGVLMPGGGRESATRKRVSLSSQLTGAGSRVPTKLQLGYGPETSPQVSSRPEAHLRDGHEPTLDSDSASPRDPGQVTRIRRLGQCWDS